MSEPNEPDAAAMAWYILDLFMLLGVLLIFCWSLNL